MNKNNSTFPQPFLPLSWRQQAQGLRPDFRTLALPLRGLRRPTAWITFADVPAGLALSETSALLLNTLQAHNLDRWVIRGVHPRFFESLPVEVALTGREALLDLHNPHHVHRPAIRALARRGLRHGQILALDLHRIDDLPPSLQGAYRRLKQRVTARYEVPLIHMYRRQVLQSDRLWVFRRHGQDQLLGAISVIASGPGAWHTEVLMRDPEAPVGIMEALVQRVFEDLRQENQRYWSLGEVPFYPTAPPQGLKARAIVATGQQIEFAYRARGLFHFKQKFQPLWRPVYLCGSPHLYWSDMASMFWSTQASRLVWQKAWSQLQRLGQLPVKAQGLS